MFFSHNAPPFGYMYSLLLIRSLKPTPMRLYMPNFVQQIKQRIKTIYRLPLAHTPSTINMCMHTFPTITTLINGNIVMLNKKHLQCFVIHYSTSSRHSHSFACKLHSGHSSDVLWLNTAFLTHSTTSLLCPPICQSTICSTGIPFSPL